MHCNEKQKKFKKLGLRITIASFGIKFFTTLQLTSHYMRVHRVIQQTQRQTCSWQKTNFFLKNLCLQNSFHLVL